MFGPIPRGGGGVLVGLERREEGREGEGGGGVCVCVEISWLVVHWFVYCASVETSADSYSQQPNIVVVRVRHRNVQSSWTPNSFMFNDGVGLDLLILNKNEKHTLPAMNIVCQVHCVAACYSHSGPVERETSKDRTPKQLAAIERKAPYPSRRPAAQHKHWHFCRHS